MKKILIFFLCMVIMGCATTSIVSKKISLGMTTDEVLKNIGIPFNKSSYCDNDNNKIEEWEYKETIWDDGGWSWDRTQISNILVFQNNRLLSFKKAKERFKTKNPFKPGYNADITIHNE